MLADVADQSLTMKSELSRIGFLGDMECGWKSMPLAGHFELHIGAHFHFCCPVLRLTPPDFVHYL